MRSIKRLFGLIAGSTATIKSTISSAPSNRFADIPDKQYHPQYAHFHHQRVRTPSCLFDHLTLI